MRRIALSLSLVAALGLVAVYATQASANPSRSAPYGKVTLTAATATLIPASPVNGRTGITIANLDTATIYCGDNSSVTNLTGYPIPANGSVSIGANYFSGSGVVKVYCYSVAGQTAPADTRYWELQ